MITVNAAATNDYIVADASELIAKVESSSSNGMVHNTELVYDVDTGRSFVAGYSTGILSTANDRTGLRFLLSDLFNGYRTNFAITKAVVKCHRFLTFF